MLGKANPNTCRHFFLQPFLLCSVRVLSTLVGGADCSFRSSVSCGTKCTCKQCKDRRSNPKLGARKNENRFVACCSRSSVSSLPSRHSQQHPV